MESYPMHDLGQAQETVEEKGDLEEVKNMPNKLTQPKVDRYYHWLSRNDHHGMWINGKTLSRNVYAHTREECEEKLKVLIVEMKVELADLKEQKAKSEAKDQDTRSKKGKKSKKGK